MNILMNILWIICGGFIEWVLWMFAGLVWCITVVGIPIGLQCFKMASLVIAPFGKEVVYGGGGFSFLVNILWIIFSGLPLAIAALVNGVILCVTIIGIPFGLQCFKFAKLALMPFGAQIVDKKSFRAGYSMR